MRVVNARTFDGVPDFTRRFGAALQAIPFFRLVSAEEAQPAFEAYQRGDGAALCDAWTGHAQATRAELPRLLAFAYDRAHLLPRLANGHAFLASVRAVLRAGERFRATLSPSVKQALETEFPWLEHRHEHIPDGWTPRFDMPEVFAAFIDTVAHDTGDLDDARARWQLVCLLNEVQQQAYSTECARRFNLPELVTHAARERELALHYFSRWAPRCTKELFVECLLVLDALNAAVFEMMCRQRPAQMIARSFAGALFRRREWQAFVEAMKTPQLLPG